MNTDKTDDVMIRVAGPADVDVLRPVVAALGMFPPEMLGELIADAEGVFLVLGGGAGFAWSRPEALTEGTWNMLALGVDPVRHRSGLGRALVGASETALRKRGARMLIVDTSGSDAFAGARGFCAGVGYRQVAVIPEYWAAGDDKVVFARALR